MDDLNEQLRSASANDNIDKVRSLIDRGADVHSRDYHGRTPLHWACRPHDPATASLLIERGADIHGRDNDGQTALHWACHVGSPATVSLLIERGAEIDSRDEYGLTALYMACGCDEDFEERSKKETAILLIRSKADIYVQSKDGSTSLDLKPEWREELTQLYEEVNRDWLARRPFLLVLIGCNPIDSESNKHNASKQTESEREREEISDELKAIRDGVLRTVYRNIAQYL